MTSFSRKMKRKKHNSIMKEFNKKMKQLRSSIKCIACGKVPVPGVDTIDNWAINDKDGITLLCEECYQEQKEVPQDEN